MREAIDKINRGNLSIRQRLQYIGHKIITGTEISAQEAAYCCLEMRLSETSNVDVYINTLLPEHSVKMLKPKQQLQSTFVVGLLNHYEQRPLAGLCLADVAAIQHIHIQNPLE